MCESILQVVKCLTDLLKNMQPQVDKMIEAIKEPADG